MASLLGNLCSIITDINNANMADAMLVSVKSQKVSFHPAKTDQQVETLWSISRIRKFRTTVLYMGNDQAIHLPFSARISGATYVGVPHTVNMGFVTCFARPKSASFSVVDLSALC